jgi:hypothetical protein
MSHLIIDAASVYEILSLLRSNNFEGVSDWTMEAAFVTVATLISQPNFQLPQSPHGINRAKGDYETLLTGLSETVNCDAFYSFSVNSQDSKNLLSQTEEHIIEHKANLRNNI